ncbi:gamma-glutamyl-gamma-aminobutyrate hydrolase family protein [Spirosoma foliorum]|uniref:Gamma-glutamyl-gamma-aminobutyrate hydrolase family protein n=1 Tax=Spirosoma foliorum TaxID=2710596 RepID=A0A7G5GP14_9BACT|nr:gamma-glutamyl-gamma-aminobutyrate hydrolase family protein [Spirosoma foliorum]QMW00606.1 gamma-glutamyl-gamma-aminobutyrate hydrolase family protein [Spirosoma foliorum]
MQHQRSNNYKRHNNQPVQPPKKYYSQKRAPNSPPIKTNSGQAGAFAPVSFKPKVGISNRPGFGYDSKALSDNKGAPILTFSLPPNHFALDREATEIQTQQELKSVQKDRIIKNVNEHLAGVHGLYIPGGQDNLDREKNGHIEKESRENYEQALIKRARNLGMPILAICGGSRSLARGFGGMEQTLTDNQIEIHNHKGTSAIAHPLHFSNVPTDRGSFSSNQFFGLLGGAAQHKDRVKTIVNKINAMNSTHQKVVALDKNREMIIRDDVGSDTLRVKGKNVPQKRMLINGKPEVEFTVWDGTGETKTPEGFETRYGAPVMGITSHPEAISGTGGARKAFDEHQDAIMWSDNIFKGFAQSMQTYAAKQQVLSDLKSGKPIKLKHVTPVVKSPAAVVQIEAQNRLPGRLQWKYNTELVALKPISTSTNLVVPKTVNRPKLTDIQLGEMHKKEPNYNPWHKIKWIEQYKKDHPENDYV